MLKKLDRFGVSADMSQGCFVAKMASIFFSGFELEYNQARASGVLSPNHIRYITDMRGWVANKLNIPVKELVEFETSLAYGLLPEEINQQLVKWQAPLRIDNNENWVVLDSVEILSDSLTDYIIEKDIYIPQPILNGVKLTWNSTL